MLSVEHNLLWRILLPLKRGLHRRSTGQPVLPPPVTGAPDTFRRRLGQSSRVAACLEHDEDLSDASRRSPRCDNGPLSSLRREFSLTEGPAPGTRSCLGSLAAAFSAGSWQGNVVNGGEVSQSRRGGSRYSPTVPSSASRRKSAWPAWRAVSSMRCSSTHRSAKCRPSRNALADS
jgi:hypothetical protein